MGFVAFASGILNYGIFPAVSARFFISFCQWPATLPILGLDLPTQAVVMAVFITAATLFTVIGGQLTVIISDCIAGLMAGFICMIVAGALLYLFSWSEMYTVLSSAPPGESMLDPFDIGKQRDFNYGYVIIGLFIGFYRFGGHHAGQGFLNSSSSAHEAKMSGILGNWRGMSHGILFTLLTLGAFTFLNHPKYAAGAAHVQDLLQQLPSLTLQNQMKIPVALGILLPVGIKGLLACAMLFLMVGCDGNYMHSWGSVFFQDVVLPFRKKPFPPRRHILFLRLSVIGVALFVFCFGLLYNQTEYITLFLAVTGAIYAGGAGAVLLGGLYWKKGTTAAAWVAMIVGSSLATGGMLVQSFWPDVQPWLVEALGAGRLHDSIAASPDRFPINGLWVSFWASVTSIVLYVVISLLTCREDFNMDRMLHRGKYAIETPGEKPLPTGKRKFAWGDLLGFDPQFTRGDKIISGSLFYMQIFWMVVFAVITIWNVIERWPLEWWGRYWHFTQIILPFVFGIATTIWFTWGGIRDLKKLFVALASVKRNALDSGMVVEHHNLDEPAEPEANKAAKA
jgi:SSS family solute:Na+ symporter